MKEELFTVLAIDKISRKTGWGPVDTWTNYNYSMLDDDIKKVTGKRISESTLKRMFGKKKTPGDFYHPHTYTKNILAEYLGYSSWDEFRKENRLDLEQYDEETEYDLHGHGHHKQRIWLTVATILFGIFFLFVFFRKQIFPHLFSNPLKKFVCENPVGKAPYTALFDYDLRPARDSVIVNFGNNEVYFLSPERKLITEFYRFGDYANVMVTMHKRLLAQTHIHVLTDGWQGGISPNDSLTAFVPFSDQSIIHNIGRLFVEPSDLEKTGHHANGDYYVEYRYFDEFAADIDHITLETIVRNNTAEGGKLCNDIEIVLKGEYHDFIIRFLEPGCFRYARFFVGEKHFYGRFDNLSELARDVSVWSDIKIDISGMEAKIYFQGKLLHSEPYTERMGNLKGIIYRFYGDGSVDYLNLKSGRDVILKDDFGKRLSTENPT